jgi:hypothetical protein
MPLDYISTYKSQINTRKTLANNKNQAIGFWDCPACCFCLKFSRAICLWRPLIRSYRVWSLVATDVIRFWLSSNFRTYLSKSNGICCSSLISFRSEKRELVDNSGNSRKLKCQVNLYKHSK